MNTLRNKTLHIREMGSFAFCSLRCQLLLFIQGYFLTTYKQYCRQLQLQNFFFCEDIGFIWVSQKFQPKNRSFVMLVGNKFPGQTVLSRICLVSWLGSQIPSNIVMVFQLWFTCQTPFVVFQGTVNFVCSIFFEHFFSKKSLCYSLANSHIANQGQGKSSLRIQNEPSILIFALIGIRLPIFLPDL